MRAGGHRRPFLVALALLAAGLAIPLPAAHTAGAQEAGLSAADERLWPALHLLYGVELGAAELTVGQRFRLTVADTNVAIRVGPTYLAYGDYRRAEGAVVVNPRVFAEDPRAQAAVLAETLSHVEQALVRGDDPLEQCVDLLVEGYFWSATAWAFYRKQVSTAPRTVLEEHLDALVARFNEEGPDGLARTISAIPGHEEPCKDWAGAVRAADPRGNASLAGGLDPLVR